MAHSNQLREFTMSDNGIKLVPTYIGPGGVLTGSSRVSQEAKEKADARFREQEIQRKQQETDRKRLALQAQIASLQAEIAAVEKDAELVISQEEEKEEQLKKDRSEIARKRMAEQ